MALSRVALLLALTMVAAPLSHAVQLSEGLSYDFHAQSCPDLDNMVHHAVQAAINKDAGVVAGLLKIFFHDCFPQVSIDFLEFFLPQLYIRTYVLDCLLAGLRRVPSPDWTRQRAGAAPERWVAAERAPAHRERPRHRAPCLRARRVVRRHQQPRHQAGPPQLRRARVPSAARPQG